MDLRKATDLDVRWQIPTLEVVYDVALKYK
jgi:hypothetical protein